MFTDLSLNPALQTRDPQRRAAAAFENAYFRGWWDRLVARLTGHAHTLGRLPGRILEGSFAGARTVALDQVRGSEDRSTDFDADFHPLRLESRERWMSIYQAVGRGQTLPPVELVQVGDTYYVRDGHHRISVARTRGQDYIEAVVVAAQRNPR